MTNWKVEIQDIEVEDESKGRFKGEIVFIDGKFFLQTINPLSVATVMAKEFFDEYGIEGVKEDTDFVVFIRISLKNFGTKEELDALIEHEVAHFLSGHRKNSREINQKLEDEVEKKIPKEKTKFIHNMMSRYCKEHPELIHPEGKIHGFMFGNRKGVRLIELDDEK